MELTTAARTAVAMPGHRILLSLELDIPSKMHVYARGVAGYLPTDWKIEEAGGMKSQAVPYPAAEKLYMKPLAGPSGELVVRGSFRYQACDDRECYVPETLALEWHFPVPGYGS